MKLRYEAKKKVKYNYTDIMCDDYYLHEDTHRWTLDSRCGDSFRPGVGSPKAFIRLLKKWSKYLPGGTEFVLKSRWVGHDVFGRTKGGRTKGGSNRQCVACDKHEVRLAPAINYILEGVSAHVPDLRAGKCYACGEVWFGNEEKRARL